MKITKLVFAYFKLMLHYNRGNGASHTNQNHSAASVINLRSLTVFLITWHWIPHIPCECLQHLMNAKST